MSTDAMETFAALLTIVAALGTVALIGLVVVARSAADDPAADDPAAGDPAAGGAGALLAGVRGAALWLAFAVAAVATVGSLYFSEVANYVPCRLCWFQRIAMYPLAPVLLVGALRRDRAVKWYAAPIAVIGLVIAGYHYLIERFPSLEGGSCEATGPLCGVPWFESFGFITLALMAGVGFVSILTLLFVADPTPTLSSTPTTSSIDGSPDTIDTGSNETVLS